MQSGTFILWQVIFRAVLVHCFIHIQAGFFAEGMGQYTGPVMDFEPNL
jgi:hypothetical protein